MSDLDRAHIPRLRPTTRYRIVGGQAVVIVQDAGEVLVLNEVGSRILELVDGQRSVGDILNELEAEYETEAETLVQDVAEYLEHLVAAGVLSSDLTPTGSEQSGG